MSLRDRIAEINPDALLCDGLARAVTALHFAEEVLAT